jgi:hypothetical protein
VTTFSFILTLCFYFLSIALIFVRLLIELCLMSVSLCCNVYLYNDLSGASRISNLGTFYPIPLHLYYHPNKTIGIPILPFFHFTFPHSFLISHPYFRYEFTPYEYFPENLKIFSRLFLNSRKFHVHKLFKIGSCPLLLCCFILLLLLLLLLLIT